MVCDLKMCRIAWMRGLVDWGLEKTIEASPKFSNPKSEHSKYIKGGMGFSQLLLSQYACSKCYQVLFSFKILLKLSVDVKLCCDKALLQQCFFV